MRAPQPSSCGGGGVCGNVSTQIRTRGDRRAPHGSERWAGRRLLHERPSQVRRPEPFALEDLLGIRHGDEHHRQQQRFLRRRAKDDKGPEDATTSTQVLEMYRSQASVSNMGGKDVDLGEDESD